MINVAILGYGVVGSGVAEILAKNATLIEQKAGMPISIKYILDIRDFPESPFSSRFVKDFQTIENDGDVQVVVETIGGVGVALDFVRRALASGKHVVTSNKELIATYGSELLEMASSRNLNLMFEGSVGGGIPILRPLMQCLTANHFSEITGILNGTTNFILTQMFRNGVTFDAALADARTRGYAEADPSDDLQGRDACRKICILASLAFGSHVFPKDVETEGIERLTLQDVQFAQNHGCSVKLLGRALALPNGGHAVYVAPHFVPEGHPLFAVEDVYNGILVVGDAIGDVMFYGRGAGKLPTASAVVADIIDSVKHLDVRRWVGWRPNAGEPVVPPSALTGRHYVRKPDGTGFLTEPLTPEEWGSYRRALPQPPAYTLRVL